MSSESESEVKQNCYIVIRANVARFKTLDPYARISISKPTNSSKLLQDNFTRWQLLLLLQTRFSAELANNIISIASQAAPLYPLVAVEINEMGSRIWLEIETILLLEMSMSNDLLQNIFRSMSVWALQITLRISAQNRIQRDIRSLFAGIQKEESILSLGFQFKKKGEMWSENALVRRMTLGDKCSEVLWIRRSDGEDVCAFLDHVKESDSIAIVARKGKGSEIELDSVRLGIYVC